MWKRAAIEWRGKYHNAKDSDEKTCANCGCLRTEHPVYSGDFLECKSYKEGAKD